MTRYYNNLNAAASQGMGMMNAIVSGDSQSLATVVNGVVGLFSPDGYDTDVEDVGQVIGAVVNTVRSLISSENSESDNLSNSNGAVSFGKLAAATNVTIQYFNNTEYVAYVVHTKNESLYGMGGGGTSVVVDGTKETTPLLYYLDINGAFPLADKTQVGYPASFTPAVGAAYLQLNQQQAINVAPSKQVTTFFKTSRVPLILNEASRRSTIGWVIMETVLGRTAGGTTVWSLTFKVLPTDIDSSVTVVFPSIIDLAIVEGTANTTVSTVDGDNLLGLQVDQFANSVAFHSARLTNVAHGHGIRASSSTDAVLNVVKQEKHVTNSFKDVINSTINYGARLVTGNWSTISSAIDKGMEYLSPVIDVLSGVALSAFL